MTIRLPFQFLFLAFVAAGVYYPSIFAPELTVDDARMLTTLINKDRFDLVSLFFPAGGIYYYRPLLVLSFYMDRLFFLCHPTIMHFENILLHVGNSCLLFWFARQLLRPKADTTPGLDSTPSAAPLLIALLFAIHPLTTEPVNWISGRTDLLAGFFALLTLNLFWYNRRGPDAWSLDCLAALSLLLGLFGKEVAAAAFLVILAALFWRELNFAITAWRQRLRILLPYVITLWGYFSLRSGSFLLLDNGVRSAITGTKGAEHFTFWNKIIIGLKALGFYATKIIWPFPLNFAIVEVNAPLSLSAAFLVLVLLAWLCLRRQGTFSFLLVSTFLFVSPALLVATSKMAWTPLAERYLYIPLMFFACAMVPFLGQRLSTKLGVALFGVLLMGLSWATVSRNLVWQNNLTLFADVVQKSPTFVAGHNEYAVALARAGKVEEAKEHFAIAARIGQGTSRQLAKANLAWLDAEANDFLNNVDSLLSETSSQIATQDLLMATVKHIDRLSLQTEDAKTLRRLTAKNIELHNRLYALTKDPFSLYRQGQLYLSLGEKKRAEGHFTEACSLGSDYYKEAACTLAARLQKERTGK